MRILIVEDEQLVATVLQDQLTELGYDDVILAADLASGCALLETGRPDFAILDVNLGRAQVFPLAAELAARRVPFVFSTGEPRDALPAQWRDCPIVRKPARFAELGAAIAAWAPHA